VSTIKRSNLTQTRAETDHRGCRWRHTRGCPISVTTFLDFGYLFDIDILLISLVSCAVLHVSIELNVKSALICHKTLIVLITLCSAAIGRMTFFQHIDYCKDCLLISELVLHSARAYLYQILFVITDWLLRQGV